MPDIKTITGEIILFESKQLRKDLIDAGVLEDLADGIVGEIEIWLKEKECGIIAIQELQSKVKDFLKIYDTESLENYIRRFG